MSYKYFALLKMDITAIKTNQKIDKDHIVGQTTVNLAQVMGYCLVILIMDHIAILQTTLTNRTHFALQQTIKHA